LPRWKNALQTNDEIQRFKREAVLKEAGRAFGKRGYHNTSLDEVAKALQVSKGTLYNYVRDKQEILFECHKLAQEIGDRAIAYGTKQGRTGAEKLRLTLEHYIQSLTLELGACAVLMEIDALREEDRDLVVDKRNAFEKDFISMIQTGIRDGSIRKVDPKLAVFTFMGALNWLPRWFTPGGRMSGKDIATQMTDLVLAGMLNSAADSNLVAPAAKKSRRGKPEADGPSKRRN
jgi:AcrR family transcriptional regulator